MQRVLSLCDKVCQHGVPHHDSQHRGRGPRFSFHHSTFLCHKHGEINTSPAGPSILARKTHVLKLRRQRLLSKNCFVWHDGNSKWQSPGITMGTAVPEIKQSSILFFIKASATNRSCKSHRNSPTLTSRQAMSVGISGQIRALWVHIGSHVLLWASTAIRGAQSQWWWLLSQAMKEHLWVAAQGCTAQAASTWEMEAPSISVQKPQ